jgi:asparagine synthase (glutamine-hydrolysing)
MCGIAGFLGSFSQSLLSDMIGTIAHRGPDDNGICLIKDHGLGLAHRRLAIIDLSSAGHQPMWDVHKRAVIVFNGEIYNYRELRSELIRTGFQFRSDSDTEVLLNLYLRDGEAMLSRLNGIFAFAIWNVEKKTLLLARDGLGIKPLYYAQTPRGFLFASEMKALLKETSIGQDIDPSAVQAYLTYLWCPAPHTMLKGVSKLEPGYALRVREGKIEQVRQFYDLPYSQAIEPLPEEDAVQQVQDTIRQAVGRQMVADVPVGAFLSGGLDSGAIMAFAREFAGSSRIQCFTIAFEGPAAEKEGMTADLPYAQKIARHLDVDLHTVSVGPNMVDQIEKMIYHLDEPQADPASLNVLFISQLARANGIKVLLSGAGGDDIFTGYRRHHALLMGKSWAWLPKPARARLKGLTGYLPLSRPWMRRTAKALQYAELDGDESIVSYFYWCPPSRVSDLCKPLLHDAGLDTPTSLLLSTLAKVPAHTPTLNRMLYLEAKHFLADHNLNYTDKMSMAAGVEVRVPLLDPDLISLACRLPINYKQRGGEGKWILKKAMEPYLPRDVIYRPKTGFGAPLRYWLRSTLRPVVEEVLSQTSLQRRGLFDPDEVAKLVMLDRQGKVDGAYTIFSLMCIEWWCRIFLDRSSAHYA